MKNKLINLLPYVFIAGFFIFVLLYEVEYERKQWDQCTKERSVWRCLIGVGQ
jgi:hypothetical protein